MQIILLENQLIEAQNERDRYHKTSKSSGERLNEMEADRKDLADEYVVLKTNYLALTNEHKKEVRKYWKSIVINFLDISMQFIFSSIRFSVCTFNYIL